MKLRLDTPLRRALREEGRRQDWLAEQLGAHPSHVSRWVQGLHVPMEATRERIAEILGREVDELWPAAPQREAA